MRGFIRTPSPAVLLDHGPDWTAAWVGAGPGKAFAWPSFGGQPLNRRLDPALREMTRGHCSYCDGYPIDDTDLPQIDHFQPKARFRHLAFTWSNLYASCSHCNRVKGDSWDERLLRPDDPGFAFGRYFIFDHASGRIEPNAAAGLDDRDRARATIDLLGLNREGRCRARRRALDFWEALPEGSHVLDDHDYRFLFE